MKKIVILGSTGSIGRQTLEIVRRFPEEFQVLGLSAWENFKLLAEQISQFQPQAVGVRDDKVLHQLRPLVKQKVEFLFGDQAQQQLAEMPQADLIVIALVGIAGLQPALSALRQGKTVALANKEALVCGGELIMQELQFPDQLLPVDSEHSAIFQCRRGSDDNPLKKIYLTSSGGPFHNCTYEQLKHITLAQALAHPTWKMGRKVTVDASTLMNKGFEVIEAHHLFGLNLDQIEVMIHPQSIIHSMIEYQDGSVLAQLSPPDMRLPIQYALSFPRRLPHTWSQLELTRIGELTFKPPEEDKFPCLKLAYQAQQVGGTMPVVLNAADEVAVEEFLQGRVHFLQIPVLIEKTLCRHNPVSHPDLEAIKAADAWAREYAAKIL